MEITKKNLKTLLTDSIEYGVRLAGPVEESKDAATWRDVALREAWAYANRSIKDA